MHIPIPAKKNSHLRLVYVGDFNQLISKEILKLLSYLE